MAPVVVKTKSAESTPLTVWLKVTVEGHAGCLVGELAAGILDNALGGAVLNGGLNCTVERRGSFAWSRIRLCISAVSVVPQ